MPLFMNPSPRFLLNSLMAFPPDLGLAVHQNLRRQFFMSGNQVDGTADVELSSVSGRILGLTDSHFILLNEAPRSGK
jgi:hypothetical protein